MYLNIKIFRFYIRCPRCAAEITFKTDPANSDYTAEHGAHRNFEPWREEDIINEGMKELQDEEEESNPMKALENRTKDSKREMEIMDALDEIRTRNARMERMDVGAALDLLTQKKTQKELEDEEDERLAQTVFRGSEGEYVKRIRDLEDDEVKMPVKSRLHADANGLREEFDIEEDDSTELPHLKLAKEYGIAISALPALNGSTMLALDTVTALAPAPSLTGLVKKRKAEDNLGIRKKTVMGPPQKLPVKPTPSALGLLGGYGSDSD